MNGREGQLASKRDGLHGGAPFTISGMKAEMNGNFIANTVTHTYAKQGGISITIEFLLSGVQSDFEGAANDGQLDASQLGYSDSENVNTGNTPVTTPN